MKKSLLLVAVVLVVLGVLAALNPNEADYREHVRQSEGLAGTLGMAMADLLSGSKNGGVRRDNYVIASKFYIGGDGILPREDVAWGFGGKIWDIKHKRAANERER
jgi:hypothetical protein